VEEQGELQDTENVEKDRDATEDDGEHEAVNDDDAGVADVATQSAITVSENLINRRACIASRPAAQSPVLCAFTTDSQVTSMPPVFNFLHARPHL